MLLMNTNLHEEIKCSINVSQASNKTINLILFTHFSWKLVMQRNSTLLVFLTVYKTPIIIIVFKEMLHFSTWLTIHVNGCVNLICFKVNQSQQGHEGFLRGREKQQTHFNYWPQEGGLLFDIHLDIVNAFLRDSFLRQNYTYFYEFKVNLLIEI